MSLRRLEIRAALYEAGRNGRPPRDLQPPEPTAGDLPQPADATAAAAAPLPLLVAEDRR